MANIINASTSSGLIQTADTSGTIELQSSGSTKLTVNSSGTVIDTLKSSSGVLATQNGMTGIAKAWCYYKGTATVGIQGSFNISSVTYVSTGVYRMNFTTAMADANYAVTNGVSGFGSNGSTLMVDDPATSTYSTTQFTLRSRANTGGGSVDDYVHVAVFGS
jgi:hypothetical protein